MTSEQFNAHTTCMMDICMDTLSHKAGEYATHDRLHNFKQAAHFQRESSPQALGGMMAKHTVSIYDMIHNESTDMAMWTEKIKDHINYLLLLWALVNERSGDYVTETGHESI